MGRGIQKRKNLPSMITKGITKDSLWASGIAGIPFLGIYTFNGTQLVFFAASLCPFSLNIVNRNVNGRSSKPRHSTRWFGSSPSADQHGEILHFVFQFSFDF
jgi:hypothetical protein